MGRYIWGALVGLLMAGCVPSYAERVGTAGTTTPPTEPMAAEPAPVETAEPEPEPAEAEPAESEPEEEAPTGIDVEWTYFAGKAADQQLGALGGPEVDAAVGPWKCKITKQETTTEGSQPVARKRGVTCKHFTDLSVGTSVTCDLDRTSNEGTLTLGADVIVIACEAK